MIPPRRQWAIQLEITNSCHRKCANCTRLTAHARVPFHVTIAEFSQALAAVARFPADSEPDLHGRPKVIGLIGGEPLLHPKFETLCQMFVEAVPRREHRGLWTGTEIAEHRFSRLIGETFGYINLNTHDQKCVHSPVLVAISDVISDQAERDHLIDNCWLQQRWSSSISPKGFFFCECASSLSMIFDGPEGIPVKPGCWNRPLADFQYQIDWACPKCGIALNLKGREDRERRDDISRSNLDILRRLGSPRIMKGEFVLYGSERHETTQMPWKYLQ